MMLTGSSYLPRPAAFSQRVLAPDGPIRIGVTPLVDESDVTLRALIGGAGVAAGSDAAFLNRVSVRDGLRRVAVRRFAHGKPEVERIADLDGACARAQAAAGALCL